MSYHQFPGNIPQFNQTDSRYQYFQSILNDFRSEWHRKSNHSSYKPPTIHQFQSDMKMFQNEWKDLSNQMNDSSTMDQETMNNLSIRINQLEGVLSRLENEPNLRWIEMKLKKRKMKRLNIRKSKDFYKRLKSEGKKSIPTDELLINRTSSDRIQLAGVKQLLAEISEKKTQAKEYLRLVDSLIELRAIRSGQQIGDDHQKFVDDVTSIKRIWLDALIEYEHEEKKLKEYEAKFNEPIVPRIDNRGDVMRIRKIYDSYKVTVDDPNGSEIGLGYAVPIRKNNKWSKYWI